MGEREFVKAIQICRRRLNTAGFVRNLVSALSIGAVAGILFQAASFVTPLYYARLYAGLALFLAMMTVAVMAIVKRTSMEQTALVMDSFGFDERIVTAYGNLEKQGAMVELQRADAMRQLQAHRDRIRITLLPPWKKAVFLAGLLVALTVLALVPADMKERARELHDVREEARDKVDELEEIVEALEQLGQEELTVEQQAVLQEMIESLQASQEEFQQASSAEMMAAASEKLDYRYENMGSQLASLAQSLQNGATVSSVTAESMQALAKKMQEMSGAQLAMQGTGGQNGDNSGNGQSGNGGEDSGNNSSGNGQSGNSGQDGQGGSGSGDGQDGGSGNGRGTGTSNTPHDYVSIPNDIADNGNLTGNAVDHDSSEYFHAQNGLSWEGTHMSHEAVIGSYEQNAYEGIAAGKYPSGMEEIIKEYFSNFN